MVVVGDEKYAISLGSIQTIEDIDPADIKLVQSKEVIHLRGNVIPIIRLNEVLDIESKKSTTENLIVVIVKKGDKFAGIVIDDLTGQQEIVIKSLGKYMSKCKYISGATILGDGEVALILDTFYLAEESRRTHIKLFAEKTYVQLFGVKIGFYDFCYPCYKFGIKFIHRIFKYRFLIFLL